MKKTIKVIYEDGKPVDLIDTEDKTTVIDCAKQLGIKAFSSFDNVDDILTELEDINPVHNEDGYKPLKVSKAARKKMIRAKIAERNADIRMKALNKFFE